MGATAVLYFCFSSVLRALQRSPSILPPSAIPFSFRTSLCSLTKQQKLFTGRVGPLPRCALQVLSEVATRPKTICSLVISRDLKDFKFSTERYCLELDDNCNLLEAQEQFRLIVGNSDQNIEVETFCLTKGKFYFMFIYYLTIFFACVQLEHSF